MVSAAEAKLVQASWAAHSGDLIKNSTEFFYFFFGKAASHQAKFPKMAGKSLAEVKGDGATRTFTGNVLTAVGGLIGELTQTDSLLAHLKEQAIIHKKMGIAPGAFADLLNALVAKIGATGDTKAAWEAVAGVIVSEITKGMA